MTGSALPLIWSHPTFSLNFNISPTIFTFNSCFQWMTWRVPSFSHISSSNALASYTCSFFKICPNSAGYRLLSPSAAATLIQTTTISQQCSNWFSYFSSHSQPSFLNSDFLSLIYASKTLVRSYHSPVKKHLTVTSHLRVKAAVFVASVLSHCLLELIHSMSSTCSIQSSI